LKGHKKVGEKTIKTGDNWGRGTCENKKVETMKKVQKIPRVVRHGVYCLVLGGGEAAGRSPWEGQGGVGGGGVGVCGVFFNFVPIHRNIRPVKRKKRTAGSGYAVRRSSKNELYEGKQKEALTRRKEIGRRATLTDVKKLRVSGKQGVTRKNTDSCARRDGTRENKARQQLELSDVKKKCRHCGSARPTRGTDSGGN